MCLGVSSEEGRKAVIELLEGLLVKVMDKEGREEEMELVRRHGVGELYGDVEEAKKWWKGKLIYLLVNFFNANV